MADDKNDKADQNPPAGHSLADHLLGDNFSHEHEGVADHDHDHFEFDDDGPFGSKAGNRRQARDHSERQDKARDHDDPPLGHFRLFASSGHFVTRGRGRHEASHEILKGPAPHFTLVNWQA